MIMTMKLTISMKKPFRNFEIHFGSQNTNCRWTTLLLESKPYNNYNKAIMNMAHSHCSKYLRNEKFQHREESMVRRVYPKSFHCSIGYSPQFILLRMKHNCFMIAEISRLFFRWNERRKQTKSKTKNN